MPPPLPRHSRCSSSGSQQATKRCSRAGCRYRCPGCPPPSYTDVRLKKKRCISHASPEAAGHPAFPRLFLYRIRYGHRSLTGNAVPHGRRHDYHCPKLEGKPSRLLIGQNPGSSAVRSTPIGAICHVISEGLLEWVHFPSCLGKGAGAELRNASARACACGRGWVGGGSGFAGWRCGRRAMVGLIEPGRVGPHSWRRWP